MPVSDLEFSGSQTEMLKNIMLLSFFSTVISLPLRYFSKILPKSNGWLSKVSQTVSNGFIAQIFLFHSLHHILGAGHAHSHGKEEVHHCHEHTELDHLHHGVVSIAEKLEHDHDHNHSHDQDHNHEHDQDHDHDHDHECPVAAPVQLSFVSACFKVLTDYATYFIYIKDHPQEYGVAISLSFTIAFTVFLLALTHIMERRGLIESHCHGHSHSDSHENHSHGHHAANDHSKLCLPCGSKTSHSIPVKKKSSLPKEISMASVAVTTEFSLLREIKFMIPFFLDALLEGVAIMGFMTSTEAEAFFWGLSLHKTLECLLVISARMIEKEYPVKTVVGFSVAYSLLPFVGAYWAKSGRSFSRSSANWSFIFDCFLNAVAAASLAYILIKEVAHHMIAGPLNSTAARVGFFLVIPIAKYINDVLSTMVGSSGHHH